jgi:PhoD-like phosphatase/FG-GAP repeat protein
MTPRAAAAPGSDHEIVYPLARGEVRGGGGDGPGGRGRWRRLVGDRRVWYAGGLALLLAIFMSGTVGASFGPGPPLVSLVDARVLSQLDRGDSFNNSGDRFGESLASGDFNGDGVVDLAVGAPGDHPDNDPLSGVAYPFRGSGGGPTAGRLRRLEQTSLGGANEAGDELGAALASGDFNGDGKDDLAVGVPGEAPSGLPKSGTVAIYFGGADELVARDVIFEEEAGETSEAGDDFGRVLASGDFNGDGFDDLAIGAPGEDVGAVDSAGALVVFRGSVTGLVSPVVLTSAIFTQTPADGDRFAAALAAGDFNNDGKDDLAVGVPGRLVAGQDGAGAVGILGGAAGPLVAMTWLDQEDAGEVSEVDDGFGAALATGDLDGDGAIDLAIGVPREDLGSTSDTGIVCLFEGGPTLFAGEVLSLGSTGLASEAGALFGSGLAIGDLDADGHGDLVVGAPGSALGGAAQAGALCLFAGAASGPPQARNVLVQSDAGQSSQGGDRLGATVTIADHDGDGRADIAAGAPGDAPTPGVLSGGVFIFPGLAASGAALKNGPLVGGVSDQVTHLWARADRPSSLTFEYKPAGTPWPGTITPAVAIGTATDLTGAVTVTGLQPDSAYEYRVLLDGVVVTGGSGGGNGGGTFRTFPPAGASEPVTFATSADLWFGRDPFPLFDSVANRQPSFILLTGDQIYADEPTAIDTDPKAYGRKYRENWGEPHFAAFGRNTPLFLMWDDHEIEENWDRGTTGRYIPSRVGYDRFQQPLNPAPRVAGGIHYAFEAGPVGFYVLDTRSYRSRNSDPDGPSKTMLGQAQKNDLKSWLLSSPSRFKFIVSTVMWNNHGTTGTDSWFGFQTERQEIFDFIRNNRICGVALLSGDQHWTGVFRLGIGGAYTLHELSPTPIGNTNRPETTDVSSEILFRYDDDRVYGLVSVDPSGLGQIVWDVYNGQDQSVYHQVLPWTDLCPDSDGDTFLDDVDCAPADATLWDRPGESGLALLDPASLVWSPPASAGGLGPPVYDLLRAPAPADFSAPAAVCLESGTASFASTDATLPPEGEARFYLVRARNACGGTLGFSSSGIERLGRTCP